MRRISKKINIKKEGRLKNPLLNVITNIEKIRENKGISFFIISVYHKAWPYLLILFVSLFFFARLFFPLSSLFMIPDFGESDVLHLNLPLKQILADNLKSGTWPLWTDNLTGGFPVLAEGQIGTFYLPNLILFKFLDLVPAYNINLLISFLLSAVGLFLFCRLLNFRRFSSVFCALVFTFSGFFSVHLNHFNLIQAASLLPLIFYAFLRIWKKSSFLNLSLFSFLFSQAIFTGHFFISFITLVGLSIYFICLSLILRINLKNTVNKFISYIFALIISLLFSAIQILPTFELFTLSARSNGMAYDEVISFPYPLKHLISFINPYFFGNPQVATYPHFGENWGIFWENTAYLGILPLLFAFLSIFLLKKKQLKIFALLLTLSLLLVLGKNSPVYFIFSFPPFNFFRVPSKFLLLTTFSLTILAGFSIDQIIKKLNNKFLLLASCFLLLAVFFADEFKFSFLYPPLSPATLWLNSPPILNFLPQNYFRVKTYGAAYDWNEIFLKNGWQNLDKYSVFTNSLSPNFNELFNIKAVSVNTGGLIPRRTKLWNSLMDDVKFNQKDKILSFNPYAKSSLSLWGSDTLVSSFLLKDDDWTLKSVFTENHNSYYIYYNPAVRPPVYFSGSVIQIETLEDFYRALPAISLNNNNPVFTENALDFNALLPGQFLVKSNLNQPLIKEYQIFADSDSLFVINSAFYPGWNIYLDGTKTQGFTVNLNQPAIYFPKGTHIVTMRFENEAFNSGKLITVVSHLIAFLMVVLLPFLPLSKDPKLLLPFRHFRNRIEN